MLALMRLHLKCIMDSDAPARTDLPGSSFVDSKDVEPMELWYMYLSFFNF